MMMNLVQIFGNVFDWMMSLTPAAAVIVIVILAVRRLLRDLVSPKLLYWLWLLLIVRLLVPSLTALPIAFPEKIARSEGQIAFEAAAGYAGELLMSDAAIPSAMGQTATISWWDILFVIWCIGVAGITVWMIVMWISMRRTFAARNLSLPNQEILEWFASCKQSLGIRTNIALHMTTRVSSPVAYGLWKPRILLPEAMIGRLSREEWMCIFTHELIHIRRRDAWWNSLMSLLVIVHWFNPLMWIAYFSMREDQELSCDSASLNHVNHIGYGKTLFKLIELGSNMKQQTYMPFHSGKKKLLQRRLKLIMVKKKPVLTLFAFSFVLLVVGAIFAIPALHAQTSNASSEHTVAFVAPAEGKITRNFGEKVQVGKTDYIEYKGTAIAGEAGTPVYAAADGVIIVSEWNPELGNHIYIRHDDHFETSYGHLDTLLVESGEQVKQGQMIGTMGSTGRSTGIHLAFQLIKDGEYVDSTEYIAYSEEQ